MVNVVIQSYQLAWSVDSYSPIEEYRFRFWDYPTIGCHTTTVDNNTFIFLKLVVLKYLTFCVLPVVIKTLPRLLYRKIKPYHGPLDSSFPLGDTFHQSCFKTRTLNLIMIFALTIWCNWNIIVSDSVIILMWLLGILLSNKITGEGDWTNVIISGDLADPGFTHMRTYLISNLLPDSE